MKKNLKALVAMFFALVIIASLPIMAFAEAKVGNVISGSESTTSSAASTTSARELLATASNYQNVGKPSSSDYFSTPTAMYVNAAKGHSVYVHYDWNSSRKDVGTAYHGSRVYAVASHGNMYCVLYFTKDYEFRAGWIKTSQLTNDYPGEIYYSDQTEYTNTYYVGDPMMSWSKDNFVGEKVKYSVLSEEINNCVGFTLDYQLVGFNGADANSVYGLRHVYVNDGSSWTYLGSFDLNVAKPCHIYISLEKPMTITAVAVIPDCEDQDNPLYRQSIIDVICQ